MCSLVAKKVEKGHNGVWLWNEMSVETIRGIRDELDETRWEGLVARLRSRPIRA
jgi:hypothetical protein